MEDDSTHSIPATHSMANFLASSIHDMKNSMNMLIVGLDKALASIEITQLTAHAELVQMNQEAKRVNNNLVQLLTLYRLGHNTYPFDPQPIHLNDFLYAIVAPYGKLLKFHGINLEVNVSPELYGYFDEDLISGVIGNALNNAMRFTRDHIQITAIKNNEVLELRIEDNGNGYPTQVLQKNGDHTHRVNFQEGSTGLGLTFSTMVARLHHNQGRAGELKLENSRSLKGACFILRLP